MKRDSSQAGKEEKRTERQKKRKVGQVCEKPQVVDELTKEGKKGLETKRKKETSNHRGRKVGKIGFHTLKRANISHRAILGAPLQTWQLCPCAAPPVIFSLALCCLWGGP